MEGKKQERELPNFAARNRGPELIIRDRKFRGQLSSEREREREKSAGTREIGAQFALPLLLLSGVIARYASRVFREADAAAGF